MRIGFRGRQGERLICFAKLSLTLEILHLPRRHHQAVLQDSRGPQPVPRPFRHFGQQRGVTDLVEISDRVRESLLRQQIVGELKVLLLIASSLQVGRNFLLGILRRVARSQ